MFRLIEFTAEHALAAFASHSTLAAKKVYAQPMQGKSNSRNDCDLQMQAEPEMLLQSDDRAEELRAQNRHLLLTRR